MKIVISQPMYFPWVGHLELLKAADIYVFYDDVAFSKGSFTNRVQLIHNNVQKWLSVPLPKHSNKKNICEVYPSTETEWRGSNLATFKMAYKDAPFYDDALELVNEVLTADVNSIEPLSALAEMSTRVLARYLGIDTSTRFLRSSELDIPGSGSDRVLEVCKHLNASEYITAHGASNYLDHENFEREGVAVKYLSYSLKPYQQLSSDFIPYVSGLDLIANLGGESMGFLTTQCTDWRDFIASKD